MYRRLVFILIIGLIISIISTSYEIDDMSLDRYINVEIKGEVVNEKCIKLPLGSTLDDAFKNIEFTNESDLSNLSRLQKLKNNQIIIIPKINNTSLISINNANIYELSSLPGIGKSTALKIIEYRENIGSFINVEDIKNVSGIGDKKYEKIKKYICL